MIKPEPQGSLFTFHEKPILAIEVAEREKFTYITEPKDFREPELQPEIFSSILPIRDLFSDGTFEQIIQNVKSNAVEQLLKGSRKAFDKEIINLKSKLLHLVAMLEDIQTNTPEFYNSLLDRAIEKLNKMLEAKLNSLKTNRDSLLNGTKFPKEADERFEAYIREYFSLKDLDSKNETQMLIDNLSIPFASMEKEASNIQSLLSKLHQKVRE